MSLERPETFRADLRHDSSLRIFKMKLSYTFNFFLLKTCLNNSFEESVAHVSTNGFSGSKSFRGFRKTAPRIGMSFDKGSYACRKSSVTDVKSFSGSQNCVS